MIADRTGWRHPTPDTTHSIPPLQDRSDLFEAARLCGRALGLSAGCRYVLDQLASCWRGELIEDRVLVWPSNEFLVEKTGLAERSVRLCLRKLIDAGVIVPRDSPNGKRYAQRDRSGRIVTAYGFDLAPILARRSEFQDRVTAQEDLRREHLRAHDEITVLRRHVWAALQSVSDDLRCHLTRKAEKLTSDAPRRSSGASPYPVRDLWRKLSEEVSKHQIPAASDGENCRHINTNTKAPESPCKQGIEQVVSLTVQDVLDICHDATDLLGSVRNERDLVEAAGRMRGRLGVSRSAWEEAVQSLGPLVAALMLVLVVQKQARPGSREIANLGGYFRVMCRRLAEGRIDLEAEVRRLSSDDPGSPRWRSADRPWPRH